MGGPAGFEQAGEWLDGLELFGMDFGTDRTRRLLARLGDPQREFRAIHVVGTNGKSSTARLADALLRAQGSACGAYLSPHLYSWTERVLLEGRPAGDEEFALAASAVARAAAEEDASGAGGPVTQFEALTAIAFLLLAQAGVCEAVVEAGLGGRLDATNVLDAPVVACTSVGLEHTDVLGATVSAIAGEKLAVVGPGATLVVSADLHPDALAVAVGRAEAAGARLVVAPAASNLAPPGTPPFLSHNLALAAAAAHALDGGLDRAAVDRAVAAGALEVPGRFEVVGRDPLTVLDGAHNPDGAVALLAALREAPAPVVACLSILDTKDAAGIIAALRPGVEAFVLTRSSHPRALDPAALAALAREGGAGACEAVEDPGAALGRARVLAGPRGTVVATGSLSLLGDLGPQRAGPEGEAR